jgi:hypothetical protein
LGNIFKISFTGDLSLTGIFYDKVFNGMQIFDPKILSVLSECDCNVCNLEGPATDKKNTSKTSINVVSPANSIQYLRKKNFNVFGLANNHVFDCGVEGFMDTRNAIHRNSCLYFGAGENIEEASNILYLRKGDTTISMIGVCHKDYYKGLIADEDSPGVFCIEYFDIVLKQIQEAKQNSDLLILNYHGGEEYTTLPMPNRRRLLKKLINEGADIVVAHHPHVFQGIENLGKRTIFYSLGNFVFDIESHRNHELTQESAIVIFEFAKSGYNYKLLPVTTDLERGIVKLSNRDFLSHIHQISDFSEYQTNWVKDAHRVFVGKYRVFVDKQTEISNVRIGPRSGSPLEFLVSTCFYRSLYRIVRSVNVRSIFLGEVVYRLLKILRRI